jgi:hypothetical protein
MCLILYDGKYDAKDAHRCDSLLDILKIQLMPI